MQLGPITVLAIFRTSPAHRKVAQRRGSGVEMAVVHEVSRRIDGARLDLETCPLFTVAPDHRETLTLRYRDNRARSVTMKQTAASRRKLLNMAAVSRSRQAKAHDLHAFAFHGIFIERKSVHVRHEIAFPRAHREPLIFLEELALGAKPIAKLERILKNKIVVMKKIDHVRRVRAAQKTHRLIGSVKMLIGNIQWNSEDRARAPFERLLGVFIEPNRRRAASLVYVDEILEQMALRIRLLAWRYFTDIGIGLLLLPEIEVRAQSAHSAPRFYFNVHQIFDKKSFDGRNALLLLKNFIRRRSQPNRISMRKSHQFIVSLGRFCDFIRVADATESIFSAH